MPRRIVGQEPSVTSDKLDMEAIQLQEKKEAEAEVIELMKKHQHIVNKNLTYLKNIPITEYDIQDAGFTIIKHKQLLDNETIEYLETLTKDQRNIKIGKLQADRNHRDLSTKMNEEFVRIRQEFVKVNELVKEDILSIKKDAVYIIRKSPETTLIDGVYNFRAKEKFSSYMYIQGKEIFLKDGELVVKGFTDDIVDDIENNLLNDIKRFMSMAEKQSRKILFTTLSLFRNNYLKRIANPEVYKNLDTGMYKFDGYELSDVDKSMIKDVDISYNYVHYIIPMFSNLLK